MLKDSERDTTDDTNEEAWLDCKYDDEISEDNDCEVDASMLDTEEGTAPLNMRLDVPDTTV